MTGARVPFTDTRTAPVESELAREVPTRVARDPGVHAATATAPTALRRPSRIGREATTLMSTVFVSAKPREFVAVNETAVEPSSRFSATHSKRPDAGSKEASFGLPAT